MRHKCKSNHMKNESLPKGRLLIYSHNTGKISRAVVRRVFLLRFKIALSPFAGAKSLVCFKISLAPWERWHTQCDGEGLC